MSIIVTLIKFGPDDFIKQRPDSVEVDLFIYQREITHSCAVRVADRMVTIMELFSDFVPNSWPSKRYHTFYNFQFLLCLAKALVSTIKDE